jgi:hypothetical protein
MAFLSTRCGLLFALFCALSVSCYAQSKLSCEIRNRHAHIALRSILVLLFKYSVEVQSEGLTQARIIPNNQRHEKLVV